MSRNKISLSAFSHELVDLSPLQKQQETKFEIKQSHKGTSFHEIGQLSRVQASTANDYKNEIKNMCKFVRDDLNEGRDERGRFSPYLLTAEHAVKYLEMRAENACKENEEGKGGIHLGRMNNIISMVEKIPAFIAGREDKIGAMAQNWAGLHEKIEELKSSSLYKEIASTPQETRAYRNPAAVVDALKGINSPLAPRSAFVAEMQCKLGLRVDNARSFNLNKDGTIAFFAKGHMAHESFKIPADLYNRAIELNGGKLGKCEIIPYRTYLSHLEKACNAVGEKYSGSHSFRHSYAQSRYNELRAEGRTEARAKAIVSEELFHRRLDVVDVYLILITN